MVCDGVLHSNRILKTLKMSVISIKYIFKAKIYVLFLLSKKKFCEQFLCGFDIL